MEISAALNQLANFKGFSQEEMKVLIAKIMSGQCTDAQIGALLMGLRLKGESVDEISGAVLAMRSLAKAVRLDSSQVDSDHLLDTCGTGGDGAATFNISTAVAIVAAAAGAKVAKHGNRSVSSSCGSADLLEEAGVRIDLDADEVSRCIEEVGIGFMFAPAHHKAMIHAIGPRKEMGIRTIFNILGPLTNPASAKNQLLGVYSKSLLRPLAEVLLRLGSKHVLLVHASDQLDEITCSGPSYVAELNNGCIEEYEISPEDFGLTISTLDKLKVKNAKESLELIESVFDYNKSSALDIVLLNAGAAIYAANLVANIKEGVKFAEDIIATGQAKNKFIEFKQFTNACKS